MKILHVINSMNTGGAEKLILDTLPRYIEQGYKVDLSVLIDNDYPFMRKLKKDFNGKIYILGSGSVYNPMVIFKLSKLMNNYDIVHVHLFPAQYFAFIAKRISSCSKTKLIFTEHNTSNRRIENKMYQPFERLVYKGYDKTICITPKIKDILKRHVNIDNSKLSIIQNGVDLKTISEASIIQKIDIDPRLNAKDIILIQVAGFRPQKDHPTVIKALLHLPKEFKLILVGDGDLKQDLIKLTKNLNLTDRVIFLGKRNDVPNLLKSADYVVLASHYEGLSLSSIEGMASGKPFIASDVPGLSEVVKGYGELFAEGDHTALANIILKLENDPAYFTSVIEKCKIRAEEFNINKMIDEHIGLYEELRN